MRRSAIWLAVLVVALGVAAGCSSGHKDQDVATAIKAKMFSDPQVKPANINVSVKDGEVTLSGEMPSDAARYQAFKLANETPGVKKVNDQMTVQVAQAAPPAVPEPMEAPAAPAPARRSHKHAAAAPAPAAMDTPPAPAAAPMAQAPAEQAAPAAPAPPPPPQPKVVEISSGTTMTIRMIDSIDSQKNRTGEVFRASLDAPLVVDNEIVVPTGTDVYVKLVQAKSAGRMTGQSELGLELVRMQYQGKSYSLVSSTYDQKGGSRGKRTAETVGGGAALGAIIGAIAGGGKGAAIGAGVGAAGGTAVQVATHGQQIRIPSETKLDFKLENPVEISYFPNKNRSSR